MPISPHEARQARNMTLDKVLAPVLERIDKMLIEDRFGYYNSFSVSGLSLLAIDYIIAQYTKVGWKVEYICDQRDGNYLKFSETK